MVTEKKTKNSAQPKTAKKATPSKKVEETAAAAADSTVVRNGLQKRRAVEGIVVSDKMQKTIVVKVDRRVRDPLYKKYVVRSHRFKAHDEKNEAKIGDRVSVVESRPLSRDKRWVLQQILRRASQTQDVSV